MRTHFPVVALLLVAAVWIAGCGEDDTDPAQSGSLDVVATTTQVADLVRNVAGDRATVHQILQPNSDPHDYEPRPSDIKAVVAAKAIFRSGGEVDEWMDDVTGNAGTDAAEVVLIDHVETREGGHDHEEHAEEEDHAEEEEHTEEEEHAGEIDPHWWQDPHNVELAVPVIRDELTRLDPEGRETYERNASEFLAELERLDRETAACIDKLAPAQRKLVTTHDALGYYADRYGLEVIGAVIPSLTSQAQPSAGDIDELVHQIRDSGVAAIFPESSLNPKLEEAVARESGSAVGEALWADTLGPEGSSGASYTGSIAANTEAIVGGLSGGAIACHPAG